MKEECRNIKILLTDFADRNLDEKTTNRVRIHLQSCPKCSREMEEITELFSLMSKIEDRNPPADMKQDFLKMLNSEKENLKKKKEDEAVKQNNRTVHVISMRFARMAAAILLLLTGFGLGYLMKDKPGSEEMAAMQAQLNKVEKEMMLMKLQEGSASQRIYAANYIEDKPAADPQITEALKIAAAADENSNVRQAALFALYHTEGAKEKEFFLDLLKKEENPLVQISLIEILVDMNDKEAVEPLEKILYDDKSMDVVKLQAKQGLEILV